MTNLSFATITVCACRRQQHVLSVFSVAAVAAASAPAAGVQRSQSRPNRSHYPPLLVPHHGGNPQPEPLPKLARQPPHREPESPSDRRRTTPWRNTRPAQERANPPQ